MGSELESEPSPTPTLSLFSLPSKSPEPTGMLTPPLRTPASVPFQWEEAPGKPRACTNTLSRPSSARSRRCLELPPRLLLTEVKVTNMPSPTTVLDGPYVGRSVSYSSFSRERQRSFSSPERGQLGAVICSKRDRGYFGSWRKTGLKVNKEVGEGSFVFPYSGSGVGGAVDGENGDEITAKVKITRIRRSGSFLRLSHTRSHLWASIYESFKQVVPWRSRKTKKDGVVM
ncbi:hypothetical protein HHK36_000058 [Tetracentron sinense]|uniref:Uncharacterized protein n=1 Tax=Tetracentron sinense TaxID=13715 RepID=A0A834ZVM7_TETSI|nr:hypothetical protein HHK36_000058 [Tetracentron sinense]